MSIQSYTGGCLCGSIRYECGEPLEPACFCHCSSCRRAAGAHVVAWVTVRLDTFRIISGKMGSFASSPPVRRDFCERCGTPLTYWNSQSADTIDVTLASFDKPDRLAPVDHVWMDDAPSWDRPKDGLPQFCTDRASTKRFHG